MASERGIFITGFPGFIGQRLVERLASESPEATFYLLVEPRLLFEAERRCRQLEQAEPALAGRWRLVVGDLRKPGLGIDPQSLRVLQRNVAQVWHLAAVYDLAVTQAFAHSVNVGGTRRVLDLCESLDALERLIYVSTCYVAGLRHGLVYEDELDCGQDFKNHYESTKYWAELEVRERLDRVPTTIVRPAIVVGDSRSGVTAKADGPYFMVQLLHALPRWFPAVNLGAAAAPFNVVPVDFVVEAMVRLGAHADAAGQTFALADPSPLTARALMQLTLEAMGRPPARGRVPLALASSVLRSAAFQRALPIPVQSLDYLDHHVEFDVSNTARLLGDALQCPRVQEYWPTLVRFAIEHPDLFRKAS
ncbi:MAG: SDR family oxidoreductase [Myxococcota bacterium]